MTRRTLILLALTPFLVVLLAALLLVWLAATPSGLRATVRLAERFAAPAELAIDAPQGTLLGPLHIGRLDWRAPERRIVAEDIELRWQPSALLDGLLAVEAIEVGRLQVLSRPSPEPAAPPDHLTLPFALRVDAFRLDELWLGELGKGGGEAPAVSGVEGRFASDGRTHRLEALRLATPRFAVHAEGTLGGVAPFPVAAAARLSSDELGRPVAIDLRADGDLRRLSLAAHSTSDSLRVDGQALLDAFAPQPLLAGTLSAVGLDPATWLAGVPHARLSVDARVVPLPGEAATLAGEVSLTNAESGRLDEARVPLRSLRLSAYLSADKVTVPDFVARFVQGGVAGQASWAAGQLAVDAELSRMNAAAWHRALQPTRLSGRLALQASAAQQSVQATLRDPRFRLAVDASRAGGAIDIRQARLAGQGGSLTVDGRVDAAGAFRIAGRLRAFDPSVFVDVPRGRLNATLAASGRLPPEPGGDAAAVDVEFALRDSQFAGRPLAGRGKVVLRPDRLAEADVTLRAGDNRLDVAGALGRPADVLTLTLAAPRLDQLGLGGALHGEVALSGVLRAPAVRWQLTAPRLQLPDVVELEAATTRGRLASGGATIEAEVAVASASLEGESRLADLSLRVDGRRADHRLAVRARVGEANTFVAAARGGLDAGRLWQGELTTLAWHGPNAFRLVDPAALEAGPDRVAVGQAAIVGADWQGEIDSLNWSPGRLQSRGRFSSLPAALLLAHADPASTLRLGGEWSLDFGARAAGEARVYREGGDLVLALGDETLPLGLQRLELGALFSGQQMQVSLHGDAAQAGTLHGRLSAGLRRSGDGWTLARFAPWTGELRVDTPTLAWLSPLVGEAVVLDGRVAATLELGGTPADPHPRGAITGEGLRIRLVEHGLDLHGGTLRVDFTPQTVRLQRLELASTATQRPNERRIDYGRLTAAPGRLVAEGEFAVERGRGRLDLRAEQIAVSQLPDRWVMLSGTGGVEFVDGRLAVGGALRIDAAYVELAGTGEPTLSRDVVVAGHEDEATPGASLARLDVGLDLGDAFYFEGAGLESRLVGELRLRAGRGETLRAFGSVRAVEGTFAAYGRELAIERGILNFQGLVDNPGLNVRAVRENLPVEAGVEVTGTVQDPVVRLVSVPAVPDTEKLSWLVLGRAPGAGLGRQDADLLLSAALALRGGGTGEGPLASLTEGLGLEELSLGTGSLGESTRFPTTHVAGSFGPSGPAESEPIATVAKRLGTNTVLSYERSVTTAESIVKLTVELTRRLSVVGRVGADNAIGLLYSFAFGGARRQ